MLLAASVSLLALAALGPPSPTTTTSTIATSTSLGRSVDDARRELNVLAGVVAQRRMRAKAVPPFFCLEGADCARQLLDDTTPLSWRGRRAVVVALALAACALAITVARARCARMAAPGHR